MILAYDIGTSFLKGAVIDANGKVLSRAQAPVRAACAEERGRHECDANTWLSGIALVTAQLSLRERSRLRGVVVSSNGPTLVPVSAEGEALDFAMTWMDRRAAEEAELISDFSESQLDASFYLPKVLWIMRHKPEMYQKTRWFLPCAEFVSFYLTGNPFRVIPTAHSREFFWNESAVPRVGVDPGKLTNTLWEKYGILVIPIATQGEYAGLRITPNIYTTLEEIDTFCAAIEKEVKKA